MHSATVFDKEGNKLDTLVLKEEIFCQKPNLSVIHQYVKVYLANQRQDGKKKDPGGGERRRCETLATKGNRTGSSRIQHFTHLGGRGESFSTPDAGLLFRSPQKDEADCTPISFLGFGCG